MYEKPLSDGNTFSCKTCHALSEPSADGLRRPGHSLGDATRRTHWKQGKAASFLAAVNSCVTEWMVAPAWREDEPRFVALRDFLQTQAPAGPANDLSYTIAAPPADLSSGSADRGQALFNTSCVVCHGPDGGGTERGPKVSGSTRTPDYVASRIRRSGSTTSTVYAGLTGGVMPFWASDRLSDAEVSDLVAFVTQPIPGMGGSGGAAANGGTPGMGGAAASGMGGASASGEGGASAGQSSAGSAFGGSGGSAGGCGATSPRVGWTADLGINTGEGQVSGFVTAIDDCTLELRDFSYDGNGIDVRVYGSETTAFKPGFDIGPNIVNKVFKKETLRVTLSADKKLTDLEWVGIWCVAVGANFGSGQLLPP
ncbi:MAG TPA: DM13 domain-containing protein [Polyangiaceae bacterium]|nr:DM13 domain-containing protein [Polyangiaceae bacterium]